MTSRLHTLIISDLHLQVDRPDITRQFLAFLAGPARRASNLLILGDLFEQWVGDDAIGPFEAGIADAIAALAEEGVRVEFIAGNRDFLLGDDYCRRARMHRCREPLRKDLGGQQAVLLHGDVLCTDDLSYQGFRARVRNPEWQARMLARPIWFRRGLARILRIASRIRTRRAPPAIMDVNEQAVRTYFESEGVGLMIHGHTHRPDVHAVPLANGTTGRRYVLGDWFDQGSVLEVYEDRLVPTTLSRG